MMQNEKITPSEFYVNYWLIDNGHGEMVHPPKLTQAEKDFLDQICENENCKGVYFQRKRRRSIQLDVEVFKEEMNKYHTKYFTPVNQPTIDKYGQIISSPTPPTNNQKQ